MLTFCNKLNSLRKLLNSLTIYEKAPGRVRTGGLSAVTSPYGSVGLAAQESRNLQLVVFRVAWRRRHSALRVELALRRAIALGRLGGRLAYSAWTGDICWRGASGWRCGAGSGWRLVLAAEPDGGQALQQRHRLRVVRWAGSPRLARIWFCAGIGSSSIRGIRAGRIARSAWGGMKAPCAIGSSYCGSGIGGAS